MCCRKLQCSGHWITEVLVSPEPLAWGAALYLGPRVFRSACSWSWGPNHREIDESSSELCNTSHRTPSQRNKAWVVLTENEATEVTCLHFFCQPNIFNCQDQEGKCWQNRNLFVTECQSSVSRILNGMPATGKKHHALYMGLVPTLVTVLLYVC